MYCLYPKLKEDFPFCLKYKITKYPELFLLMWKSLGYWFDTFFGRWKGKPPLNLIEQKKLRIVILAHFLEVGARAKTLKFKPNLKCAEVCIILATPPLWRDLVKISSRKLWHTSSFSLERTDFKNVIFEKNHWAHSEDAEVAEVKQPRNQKWQKI